MEYFLNRPLTELEIRLRDQQRCIGCGAKVYRVTKQGLRIQPFECKECTKTRTNYPSKSGFEREKLKSTHTAASLALGYTAAEPGLNRSNR